MNEDKGEEDFAAGSSISLASVTNEVSASVSSNEVSEGAVSSSEMLGELASAVLTVLTVPVLPLTFEDD